MVPLFSTERRPSTGHLWPKLWWLNQSTNWEPKEEITAQTFQLQLLFFWAFLLSCQLSFSSFAMCWCLWLKKKPWGLRLNLVTWSLTLSLSLRLYSCTRMCSETWEQHTTWDINQAPINNGRTSFYISVGLTDNKNTNKQRLDLIYCLIKTDGELSSATSSQSLLKTIQLYCATRSRPGTCTDLEFKTAIQ